MGIDDLIRKIEDLKIDQLHLDDDILILAININDNLINVFWRYEDDEEINEFTW